MEQKPELSKRYKMYAFDIWCWRKLLGVSYIDRKRNPEILDIIIPISMLESRIIKSTLLFFGHVVRGEMMELQMMLRRMEGRRGRGIPCYT